MSELVLGVGLAYKLQGAFIRNGWSLQEIDNLCGGDRLNRVRRFANNRFRFNIERPEILRINRASIPTPAEVFHHDWTIWLGPKDGDGLTGNEEQDTRSLMLTEIDFSQVQFMDCLRDSEIEIDGEEKLERMKTMPGIRLDFGIGFALFNEEGQATLRWLDDAYGITELEMAGTVMRNATGLRDFPCLFKHSSVNGPPNGSWGYGYCRWLREGRGRYRPSPVLQK